MKLIGINQQGECMELRRLTLLSALLATIFSHTSVQADQRIVDQISAFEVKYKVTDNQAARHGVDCARLGADWASCNRATITLTNPGKALLSRDWAIYMSNVHQTLKVESDQFRMVHVVGDLTRLEPTEKFKGFPAGESVTIPIVNEYWQLYITDVMPRWYVTSSNATPKVIASTDTEKLTSFVAPFEEQWKRIPDEKNVLMTATTRFDKNNDISLLPSREIRGQILPTPLNVEVFNADADLSRGVNLLINGLESESVEVIKRRFTLLGVNETPTGYQISTKIDKEVFENKLALAGGYRLSIGIDKAEVVGYDASGVFYGLQSIMSLLPAGESKKIATLNVTDAPRFPYRGVFLDVARNFHSKAVILRMLDQLSAWKINVFHFHLSDDEGWRIEIPGLPELTEVGGKRCHDLREQRCLLPQLGSGPKSDNHGSGYFTRQDYIEIVKYAAARSIQVIPEIDMPAHARAAVISMEARYQRLSKAGQKAQAEEFRLIDPTDTSNTTSVQLYDRTSYLNPCLLSSLKFADKVISEIQAMHKEAGQPLKTWHFGGDEAKNIRLGAGYTDKKQPEPSKGILDMSKQDRPWAKSQQCQKMIKENKVKDLDHLPTYFAMEVSKLVSAHGINKMQAWQDGLKDAENARAFKTSDVAINFWDTLYWGGYDSANDWAARGYEIIISSPDYVYMDFPYEVNPLERGYYWGTRFSDERKMFSFAPDNLPQNAETSVDRDGKPFKAQSKKTWPGATGISAQLWSETSRTDDQVEYMVFPRVLAVAERAWHRASWEQDYIADKSYAGDETDYVDKAALRYDWQRFANILGQRELHKLDMNGIKYRLPVPGARIIDGKLHANSALPGIHIEYSDNNGETWQRYNNALKPSVDRNILVRSVSPDGKRFSRTEKL